MAAQTARPEVAGGEATGRPAAGPSWWTRVLLMVIVVAVCLAVRLPYLRTSTRPSPDGSEYLDIARHLASGQGAVISIKAQLFDRKPVVRPVFGDRALLYPAVVAGGMRVFGAKHEFAIGRLVNIGFAALTCLFCLLLFAHIFGWRVAFPASLLVALSPWHTVTSVEPLSDEMYLLLSTVALWVFVTRAARARVEAASGALTGLAQLARPTGVLVLAALMGSAWRARRRWAVLWLVAGFVVVMSPYYYGNWRANGSPLFSTFSNNFAVGDYREGTWYGLDRKPVTPSEFVRHNTRLVAHLIAEKTLTNLSMIGSQVGPLAFLVVLLPVGWWRGPRALLLASAALNLALYSFAWAPVGATRYLMPTYLLLLPFLLEAALQPRWRWLRPARGWLHYAGPVLLALAFVLTVADYASQQRAIYARRVTDMRGWARWDPAWQRAADWIHETLPPQAVVSTNNPWLLNYRAHQPTVLAPIFSREEQVEPFLQDQAVAAVALFTIDKDRRVQFLEKDPKVRLALHEPFGKKWLFIYRTGR